MEFLIISSNKLKIMIDKSEMIKFGLDNEELDYSHPEVRSSFWNILDIAAKECGFQCKGEKILIQFYPSKSGAEIFITKLGILSKSAERSLSASSRVAMLSSKVRIYKFDDDSSISFALRITQNMLPEAIKVFSGDDGEYYLIYEERLESSVPIMAEFGTEIPKELEGYISERANLISEPYKRFKIVT